jgi:hypothetical protein
MSLTQLIPLQAKPGTKYPELEKILDNKDEKGVEETMKVSFRKVDPFDLWVIPDCIYLLSYCSQNSSILRGRGTYM